jgi:hypothetical protein
MTQNDTGKSGHSKRFSVAPKLRVYLACDASGRERRQGDGRAVPACLAKRGASWRGLYLLPMCCHISGVGKLITDEVKTFIVQAHARF